MEWQFIVALVIAIPIILFPAAFIWYLNLGWIFSRARKTTREMRTARGKKITAVTETRQHATVVAPKK